MRIIQTKASFQTLPNFMPYLHHIKDKAKIDMDQNHWDYPENQDIILTCKMTHELSSQGWLKRITVTHQDHVLWTHEFSIGQQRMDSRTHWCFMSAGADWHPQLSQIIQLYKTHPTDGPRLSKAALLERMTGEVVCFPHNIENRSLVRMVEEGCITYQGLKSIAIQKSEPDSQWVKITFSVL